MYELLKVLIVDLIEDFTQFDFINSVLENAVMTVFYLENSINDVFSGRNLVDIYKYMQGLGIALASFKLLKKGYDKYILQIDGDPESDIYVAIFSYVKGLILALTFIEIYDYAIKIPINATEEILEIIVTRNGDFIQKAIEMVTEVSVLGAVVIFIGLVLTLVLYMQFIMRGAEMLILRIGFPVACLGIQDSDGGVFKAYLTKFYQIAIGTVVQVVVLQIGLKCIIYFDMFIGIAFLVLAIKMPKVLSEFVFAGNSGGGNVMSKAYYGSQLFKAFKSLK